MSQHPSLKVGGAAEAKRTVLTRYERVELLRKRGELKEDDRITGLKKTKPGGIIAPGSVAHPPLTAPHLPPLW